MNRGWLLPTDPGVPVTFLRKRKAGYTCRRLAGDGSSGVSSTCNCIAEARLIDIVQWFRQRHRRIWSFFHTREARIMAHSLHD